MTSEAPPAPTRCRSIEDRDLDALVGLLSRGFPSRPAEYWRQGFRRQAAQAAVPGMPRYGLMLESQGRPVGLVLMLSRVVAEDGNPRVRCNLSSWYVEPEFRAHASMLVFMAVRRKEVTYVNISPAPHTVATIEAQGFRRFVAGSYLGVPSLKPGVSGAAIHRVTASITDAPFLHLPERDLLLDHAAMGCLSLVVEAGSGLHPFVFLPFRIRSGRYRPPVRQLIYARAIEDYRRFAGPLGRFLLWRGSPFVVHDADGAEPWLAGRFFDRIGQKFFRGPHMPRAADLAYTERVIFGP